MNDRSAELSSLLEAVAQGAPPSAEAFELAEVAFLEARAIEQRARELFDQALVDAMTALTDTMLREEARRRRSEARALRREFALPDPEERFVAPGRQRQLTEKTR